MSEYDRLKDIHEQLRKIALNSHYPIITATQIKPYNPYYTREITEEAQFFLVDYIDNMKVDDGKEEIS